MTLVELPQSWLVQYSSRFEHSRRKQPGTKWAATCGPRRMGPQAGDLAGGDIARTEAGPSTHTAVGPRATWSFCGDLEMFIFCSAWSLFVLRVWCTLVPASEGTDDASLSFCRPNVGFICFLFYGSSFYFILVFRLLNTNLI
jgi:hypothetical protein